MLDKDMTVYETLDNIAVGDIRTKLRDILAEFLFRGEDIDKKVSVLSGGERARLGMAKLMLQPYNLLALDEPTNHMDIKSKEILQQALKAYDGTLIVVSHDRIFLDGLVDKLYEFRDGRVKEHVGSIEEFLEERKIENLHELERRFGPSSVKLSSAKDPLPKTNPERDEARRDYNAQKILSKEDRKVRNRISYLESEIGKLEKKNKEIEAVLSSPGKDDDIMELTRTYLENQRSLEAMTDEWGRLVEQSGS